ncbi:MAG TPA: hypothetical protein DCE23_01970 [Firmicutes bacterium]|nr:hypothetical protein [Bacillota bacterium]
MANKDYTSVYSIEDFMLNKIAPLYMDKKKISTMNIGLQGYVTHVLSDMSEDISNMVSAAQNESLPNTAKFPSTLYANAALYRIDKILARPAVLNILFLLREKDILSFSEVVDDMTVFKISGNTKMTIDNFTYMLEDDITISSYYYKGELIYIAKYDRIYENDLSVDSSPYIRTMRVEGPDGVYLALNVKVLQVNKSSTTLDLVGNKIIHFPKITVNYSNGLANFEVLYKPKGESKYTRLKKLLRDSPPITDPFCFYTFANSNEIQISFSSRDRYFTPEYNSELKIDTYTTSGASANFDSYMGTIESITVTFPNTNQGYKNIKTYVIPQSGASGGRKQLSMDELKELVIKNFSTVCTIVTEHDLELHFNSIDELDNITMLFKKKRDDVIRLFSAFSYYKDMNGTIMHTNTGNICVNKSDLPLLIDDVECSIIRPGSLFVYNNEDASSDDYTLRMIKDADVTNDLTTFDNRFIYTNPFLINVMHRPSNLVEVYLSDISQQFVVNYDYINEGSKDQFLCVDSWIVRNALRGSNTYSIFITLTPCNYLSKDIVNIDNTFNNNLKVKLIFDDGSDTLYADADFYNFNAQNMPVFRADITTDDYVSLSNKLRCGNLKKLSNNEYAIKLLPLDNLQFKICAFMKSDKEETHKYTNIPDISNYKLCNIYSPIKDSIQLLVPFNCVRSSMTYMDPNTHSYDLLLSEIPLFSAKDLQDEDKHNYMINTLRKQYKFINETTGDLVNNYNIDLKFTGTYGKSRNFITEREDQLDRLNCSVTLDVFVFPGVDRELTLTKVESTIIDFFESLNITKDNSIKLSNLIQYIDEIEEVDYLRFGAINDYDPNVQVLYNKTYDSDYNGINFIPEFVNIRKEDIHVNII